MSGAAPGDATTFGPVGSERDWYVFVSLDSAGSTAFKEDFPFDWFNVVQRFYDNVRRELDTRTGAPGETATRVWKYLGDEVVLMRPVADMVEIERLLTFAGDLMAAFHKREEAFTPRLGIKGTAWIADFPADPRAAESEDRVRRGEGRRTRFRNRRPFQPGASTPGEDLPGRDPTVGAAPFPEDFIGPEMDAGFRLSKHTHNGLFAVSAELAYLLADRAPYKDERRLRRVDFVELKGVWNGRLYPLFWLTPCAGDAFRFAYDDCRRFPLTETWPRAEAADRATLTDIFAQAGVPERPALLTELEEAAA